MDQTLLKERNRKIAAAIRDTREKRKSQYLKVYELKVSVHHTSKEDFQKLSQTFKEAKWVVNDVIASEDIFKYYYKDHRTNVRHFDKDENEVFSDIHLNTAIHDSLVKGKQTDIINLSKKKKKGGRVGRLKFVSEVNSLPLRPGSIHLVSKNRISIPGFRKLCVYGLEQFINKSHEIADGRLIRKASGYYVKVSVYFDKTKETPTTKGKSVGLDFGIETNIATSDGEKINASVQETEYLKFLQKQLHRKQKNSKRYWKLRNQIRKEYEHCTNKRNDSANKVVHKLLSENDIVYYQDEQIAKWKKFSRGMAKEIHHSILGRVKQKLNAESEQNVFKISKRCPTTKLCLDCGTLHQIRLNERTFVCPTCGRTEDRDVHAAKNVLEFGRLLKKAKWMEHPFAEAGSSGEYFFELKKYFAKNPPMKRKREDSHL